MRCNPGIVAGALLALLLAVACGPEASAPETPIPDLVALRGEAMGTTWTVKVIASQALPSEEIERLGARVQAALAEVDSKMSHYRDDSEITRFNRHAETTPFPVSAETLEVLALAGEVSTASDGAFDVTIAPLVDAWGFGPAGRPANPPAEEEIERLLATIGWRHLTLDPVASTVAKDRPELTLDLSAIAKGYAVDRVAAALDGADIASYMVEVGGEVRTRGVNELSEPWRIAIERPVAGARELGLVVPLSGRALATSGDYRNYYEVDGRRISHTLDPRTGRPVTHRLAAVSVVDDSCARADAWATALLVLGPDGFASAESQGLAALFLVRKSDGAFSELRTAAFEAILAADTGG